MIHIFSSHRRVFPPWFGIAQTPCEWDNPRVERGTNPTSAQNFSILIYEFQFTFSLNFLRNFAWLKVLWIEFMILLLDWLIAFENMLWFEICGIYSKSIFPPFLELRSLLGILAETVWCVMRLNWDFTLKCTMIDYMLSHNSTRCLKYTACDSVRSSVTRGQILEGCGSLKSKEIWCWWRGRRESVKPLVSLEVIKNGINVEIRAIVKSFWWNLSPHMGVQNLDKWP